MNERNYSAGWSNFCKVVCAGANGLGYVLVLVLNWDHLPVCVGARRSGIRNVWHCI